MSDEQLAIAYRHDAHKMRGQSHGHAPSEIRQVAVNQKVPEGADKAAADLSRPEGEPKHTMPVHDTHYRRSLLNGQTAYDPEQFSLQQYRGELERLLTIDDADAMHEAWLKSNVVGAFNESVFYPYTSLKYHTLLVASLVSTFRKGHEFDDLYLNISLNGGHRTPHRTIFDSRVYENPLDLANFTLSITPDENGGAAKISSYPRLNWSFVWGRLPFHPVELDDSPAMTLDANLRRITSWSTALQYTEDVYRSGFA